MVAVQWPVPIVCWTMCFMSIAGFFSPAVAADDLAAMLRLVSADGETTLVVDDLAAMETELSAWRPLLGATGFGAESIAALRKLLPFSEWVNVTAPLAFRPPAVGTADKAVYWLHIPQFKEKIAALPTASEDNGMWRATDKAGVTWYAKASGEIVILSASRIHVDAAGAPGRTLFEEYESHQEMLSARNLLLHMKSSAYATQLIAAMESLAGSLSAPAADGRTSPLSSFAAQSVQDSRAIIEQTRSVGLLLHVDGERLAASFVLWFRDGPAQEYLKGVRDGAECVRKLALTGDTVFAAGWCEPSPDSPLLGPWLNRRIDALDAPLKSTLADLRAGAFALAPEEMFFRAVLTLSADNATAARQNLVSADRSADAVRQMLNAFRGTAPDPAADAWYDAIAPLFSSTAPLAVSGSDKEITLRLEAPPRENAAADAKPEEIPRLRTALGQLNRDAKLIVLVDPAGLLPVMARFGLAAAPLNQMPPGPLAGIGVNLKPAGIRIDVHIPKASLERIQEATTPSGPT